MGDEPKPLSLNTIGITSVDQAEAGGAEDAARVSGFYRKLLQDQIEVTFAQELTDRYVSGMMADDDA